MSDIHIKLAKIAGGIGSINKTERNKEQGFNYRSIEQITEKARPLLATEGVSTAPRMVSLEHSEVTAKSGARGYRAVVVMAYTFTAGSDDSAIEVSMPGEAVDYGDKSTSKAVQMAYKYALTQVLQIGSGDDPDGHSVDVGHVGESKPRPRSGPQQRTPRNRPTATETAVEAPSAVQASESAGPSREAPDIELVRWVAKQKLALLDGLAGDKEKAKTIWADVLSTYGLDPGQLPVKDSLPFIESDLSIAMGEALMMVGHTPEPDDEERPF